MPLELSKTLLAALRCPDSKQSLNLADEVTLERLNQAIAAGGVVNLSAKVLSEPITAGLIREDRQRLYLITDGFPVMLVDEAIDLRQLDS